MRPSLCPLLLFCAVAGCAHDPSPGIFTGKEEARNLECARLSHAQAHREHPGVVREPYARGSYGPTDALVCSRRLLEHDERPAQHELILSGLRRSAEEITQVAGAHAPLDVTWHVDAYHPDARVASKMSVATKTALAEKGRKVSDRVPLLAAGDLLVLSRLVAGQAYPLACARYFAGKGLDEREVLLALVSLDSRDGQIHAGLCMRGEWKWLL